MCSKLIVSYDMKMSLLPGDEVDSESSKRRRASYASFKDLFHDSDEHSRSPSGDSDSDSECEWPSFREKKRKSGRKKNRRPIQTLKKKLEEKTRTLRKSFDSVSPRTKSVSPDVKSIPSVTAVSPGTRLIDSLTVVLQDCNAERPSPKSVHKTEEAISQAPTVVLHDCDAKQPSPKIVHKTEEMISQALEHAASETTEEPVVETSTLLTPDILKTEPSIDKVPILESKVCFKKEKTDIKQEQKVESVTTNDAVIVLSDEEEVPPLKNPPVVLNCSITKTFASPLLATTPTSSAPPVSPLLSALPTIVVPGSVVNPSLMQSNLPISPLTQNYVPSSTIPLTPSQTFSNGIMLPDRVNSTSPSVPRIRVNPEFQQTPGSKICVTPVSKRGSVSAPSTPRSRNNSRTPRTPTSFPRSTKTGSTPRSSYKPRRIFPEKSPVASVPAKTVTPRTPISRTSVRSSATLSSAISANNISPSGTVIRRGSNSVTITPRTKSPERRPVNRKLIRNEVEGSIAARAEDGVLRYVVNLANGTHMPLTNLQVRKLREQNNGVLPTKLRIPVPSDVAAQIEPIVLIDD